MHQSCYILFCHCNRSKRQKLRDSECDGKVKMMTERSHTHRHMHAHTDTNHFGYQKTSGLTITGRSNAEVVASLAKLHQYI